MPEVSPLRLNLLRACYLLMVVGLGITIWPGIIVGAAELPLTTGFLNAMLGGLCLVSILGLLSPLRLLPILIFEVTFKLIWSLSVALPLWLTGQFTPAAGDMLFACAFAIPFVFIIPWGYVWSNIVRTAEAWR